MFFYVVAASPAVNNVTITADYTLPDGSQVLLISEVLFVSEAVVSRLHQVSFFPLVLAMPECDEIRKMLICNTFLMIFIYWDL